MAEKVTKKGTNMFMRTGHTSGNYGNDPSIKGINRNSEAKEIKAG